ncbi:MAG: eukaryotic-like serine/threonine-protein kinase [Gaiellaceae bacterium]|nr:eukaryotic-like serine/threonine-protein kinase [Gaiellaceae bacterium]
MIAPGTVLQNRYAVERQIGAGGMGAVYVATDRRFGSTVALKETFFDDPALRRAFEREARLLNRLRHSALPRVSDHFEESEGQFLVMEYISGEDLSQMLKARNGSGFPARQVLGWADQLLDALDYLHTQEPSVIHRDIKPQNLKLTARDQVVLLDFGLAKGTPLQTRVTQTGSLFGYSFNYAPIEQMQGAGTDPRSDLYSLGATLYHLLTGMTPPDALTRATAVLNGEPDPLRPASETAAHVPAEVSDVLSRAMALSAARRFASAEEMRAALRDAALAVTETLEASGAATLLSGVESEQKTRLMNSAAARTSAQEPATLLNDGPSAARTSARGVEPTSAEGADGKSVVTRVRVADASPREHPRRALYVVLGLVCIALAGAGVYSFVQSALPGEPAAQPTPQPTAQSTPPEVPAPSAQQSAEATPTPAATPAAAQKRATAAHTLSSTQPEVEHPAVPAPHAPPPGPELPPETAADPILRGRDLNAQPLTREEWRAIFRRAAEERRKARMERDRVLEEQRRQRRLEQQQRRRGVNPYPPAPPPP